MEWTIDFQVGTVNTDYKDWSNRKVFSFYKTSIFTLNCLTKSIYYL